MIPPSVLYRKYEYIPFKGMRCSQMPDSFSNGRPKANRTTFWNKGIVERTSDSWTHEEEMGYARMVMNCFDYSRAIQMYLGNGVSTFRPAQHAFHDSYTHPQDMLHFAFAGSLDNCKIPKSNSSKRKKISQVSKDYIKKTKER